MNPKSDSKNAFYNTLGTFFYFFCQWLLTIFVVRLSGYRDAGIFSLCVSITNIFYCIALYGMRNYQISDIQHKFTDKEYFYVRSLTIVISLILFGIILHFLGLPRYTTICVSLYMIYKVEEAYSDLLFAYNQIYDQYRKIAISYICKGIGTLLFFIVVLKLTKGLALTILSNVAIYGIILVFYDYFGVKKRLNTAGDFSKGRFILSICFPLMVYSGLVPYVNFITRYCVEIRFGTTELGYYSSVTMVFAVLNTLMNSIFVTIIPNVTRMYYERSLDKIRVFIKRIIIFCIGLLAISMILVYFFADFIFGIIFGAEIIPYLFLLYPTIISAIALSLFTFFCTLLIAMGRNTLVLVSAFCCAFVCSVLVYPLTSGWGMFGASLALLIGLLSGVFVAILKTKSTLQTISSNSDPA